ncbi:MAG: hypothetical protein KIH01_05170 [Candidatus Freyarchaeota archaeon]|nr:hypothetical protein [Candidatus Jordarchaeia archaeon]
MSLGSKASRPQVTPPSKAWGKTKLLMGEGKVVEWFMYKGDVLQLVRRLAKHLIETGVAEGIVSGVSKEGKVSLHIARSAVEVDESPLDHVLLHGYRGLESTVRAARERKKEKLAVLVKPCEARAIVELAKRRQVDLNLAFIIGFDCPGIRANSDAGDELKEAMSAAPSGELLRDACRRCEVHAPPHADVYISLLASPEILLVGAKTEKGTRVVESLRKDGVLSDRPPQELLLGREKKLKLLDEKGRETLREEEGKLLSTPNNERLSWFMGQLNSCTRCSACIRACPLCFCKDCVLIAERKKYSPSLFLVTRMLHMADACVCCGKCDEVCPKSIPLSYMFYHLGRRFTSRHSYLSGVDFSKPPRIV